MDRPFLSASWNQAIDIIKQSEMCAAVNGGYIECVLHTFTTGTYSPFSVCTATLMFTFLNLQEKMVKMSAKPKIFKSLSSMYLLADVIISPRTIALRNFPES